MNAVSFAHDCVHVALGSADGEWSVVAARPRREPREHARGKAPGAPFERVALSPFATRLVGASAAEIAIIDVTAAAAGGKGSNFSLIDRVPTGHGRVTSLSFSFDGTSALSGGSDGRLRLWRVEEPSKAGTV